MRGLYNATSSMLVNQVHLEHVSNNLANLDTPGYRRSEVTYKTFPEILLCRTEKAGKNKTTLSAPIGVGAASIAVDETVIFQQSGNLSSTDRKLDFALQGEGFFAIQTPNGMQYTRDGHFMLSSEGILVNPLGFPVMGVNGPITLSTEEPHLDHEGYLVVDGEQVDRLQIYFFAGENMPVKVGHNLFRLEGGGIAEPVEAPEIVQGHLEGSNADLTRHMVELVKVRRSYEAAQKVSQIYDRLLSRSANELGSLR